MFEALFEAQKQTNEEHLERRNSSRHVSAVHEIVENALSHGIPRSLPPSSSSNEDEEMNRSNNYD